MSPEASVETISFGTPKGSSRMPAVTIEVPPPPPMPTIAARSLRVRRKAAKAGPWRRRRCRGRRGQDDVGAVGVVRGDLLGGDVSGDGGARVPRSTVSGAPPASWTRAAR